MATLTCIQALERRINISDSVKKQKNDSCLLTTLLIPYTVYLLVGKIMFFKQDFFSLIPFQRTTVKRMCIKTLPPVLVIQLKRFGYDWEAGRALKFDDHFEVM